jgi:hypothetical protein
MMHDLRKRVLSDEAWLRYITRLSIADLERPVAKMQRLVEQHTPDRQPGVTTVAQRRGRIPAEYGIVIAQMVASGQIGVDMAQRLTDLPISRPPEARRSFCTSA